MEKYTTTQEVFKRLVEASKMTKLVMNHFQKGANLDAMEIRKLGTKWLKLSNVVLKNFGEKACINECPLPNWIMKLLQKISKS